MADSSSRQRLLTFGVIGIINTAVDVSLFLTLRHAGLSIILANIISTSVAVVISYFLNKRFTFRATTATRRSLPLFIAVSISGTWVLQPIVIKLVLYILGTHGLSLALSAIVARPQRFYELVAKLAATPATLIWNYVFYKHVVFKAPKQSSKD